MGYKAWRVPHMDNLCIPGGYFWGRTSENSISTKFVNKAKGRAGAMRWMLRATLKSKVLLYALALTYLLREHL
jgi:hypothetical protein